MITPHDLGLICAGTTGPGLVLAVDVGGTEIKGALLEQDANCLFVERRPTGAMDGPEAVLDRTARLLSDLGEQATRLHRGGVLGAGVAVPGVVDEMAGIAYFGANIAWNKTAVVQRLEATLGMPVVLSHDVRAAGLAEAHLGAARGADNWVFIALGTGVAGAVFIARRPVVGVHGRAGELGHLCIDPQGSPCGCGGRGCLETISSAAAIARRYTALCPREGAVSAQEVLNRAEGGDRRAIAVRDEAVEALASMVITYQGILDSELVVIGGGLSLAGDSLFGPLRAALHRHSAFPILPKVLPAALGAEAGCIGAGLAAWATLTPDGEPQGQ